MAAISGVSWEEAWASKQAGEYLDVPVYYIGFDALLTNKRSAGRLKDQADVHALVQNRPGL